MIHNSDKGLEIEITSGDNQDRMSTCELLVRFILGLVVIAGLYFVLIVITGGDLNTKGVHLPWTPKLQSSHSASF